MRADGHEILTAHTGRSALELVAQHKPNAVMLDIGLADMSGMDVCRRIKNDETIKHIPVILLSAASNAMVESNAKAVGAYAFIAKPYEPAALIQTLRCAMGLTAEA